MLEILQTVNLIIVIVGGGFGLIFSMCKPFRDWLLKKKKQEEAANIERESQHATDRCILRNMITNIYYKHQSEQELREYEYENLAHLYERYKQLGGNSFIDKIWDEIQEEWTVIR